MSRVVCLVLAAGLSRRMAPANKLLEPFGSSTVLATTLAGLEASAVDDILVVVGHEAARVADVARGSRVVVVTAERYADGMASTLASGLARVAADAAGVLICLADMPLVRADTVDRLLARFEASIGARPVVAPRYRGRRGNPVLWHRDHLGALALLDGEAGGRSLLARREVKLDLIDVDDPGVLIDVDTPEALRRARATLPRP